MPKILIVDGPCAGEAAELETMPDKIIVPYKEPLTPEEFLSEEPIEEIQKRKKVKTQEYRLTFADRNASVGIYTVSGNPNAFADSTFFERRVSSNADSDPDVLAAEREEGEQQWLEDHAHLCGFANSFGNTDNNDAEAGAE